MLQMILIMAGLGSALIATIVILLEWRALVGYWRLKEAAAPQISQSMQSKGRLSWRPLFRACTHKSAMSAYSPTAAHKPTFHEGPLRAKKANYTGTSAVISGLGNMCAVALSHLSTWLTVIARNCSSANYWMESSGNQPWCMCLRKTGRGG